MSKDFPEVPDESVQYLRDIEVHSDAEDVKRVEFIGDAKSVEVGITDEVMVEFVEAGKLPHPARSRDTPLAP